ncbi:STAS domain-containing protein [Haliovirga abyssi]|uniref:STAS domain-containing protein n=1 Tax=Haliovirga abyssi TaxID=2996794 RepID=A0AAU9DFS3_9FUSO|nr:STAS domain-containing protein [Haliovirga abyssi]BDU51287.1 hypothetical protein HLVA_18560 [Haliovirga abyssi]
MDFKILKELDEIIIVGLSGEISIDVRERLQENFAEVINKIKDKKIKKLQIDLQNITYIDSIGISYFVKLKSDLKKMEVEFDFLNTPKIVMKIFSLLSLDTYFNFYES